MDPGLTLAFRGWDQLRLEFDSLVYCSGENRLCPSLILNSLKNNIMWKYTEDISENFRQFGSLFQRVQWFSMTYGDKKSQKVTLDNRLQIVEKTVPLTKKSNLGQRTLWPKRIKKGPANCIKTHLYLTEIRTTLKSEIEETKLRTNRLVHFQYLIV